MLYISVEVIKLYDLVAVDRTSSRDQQGQDRCVSPYPGGGPDLSPRFVWPGRSVRVVPLTDDKNGRLSRWRWTNQKKMCMKGLL